MSKLKHTPTPWRLSAHDVGVILSDDPECPEYPYSVAFAEPFVPGDLDDGGAANAAFIIEACNAHERYQRALETIAKGTTTTFDESEGHDVEFWLDEEEMQEIARKALAPLHPSSTASTADPDREGRERPC